MSNAIINNYETGFTKYRGLIISITVLAVLIISLLVLNLYLTRIIEKGSKMSLLAGGQSTLINEISKEVFLMNAKKGVDVPTYSEKQELKESVNNYDKAINAFFFDSTLDLTNGESLSIEPRLLSEETYSSILEAHTIWGWYKEGVTPVFTNVGYDPAELTIAQEIAESYSNKLTLLMESATQGIQNKIDSNIRYIQNIQYIGIILTVFMLAWTIFVTARNLRKTDKELDQARVETDGILRTVREGLFLLNEDLIIGSQYSDEVENILETRDVSGRTFNQIIEPIVSRDDMESFKDFVKLLFDASKVEDLITSLNPLERVRANFSSNNTSSHKDLGFAFNRVKRGNKIVSVLVSIRDISEMVLLEEQLEEVKNQSTQSGEMVTLLLKADQKLLRNFIKNSRVSLSCINNTLRDQVSGDGEVQQIIDDIFVEIHRVKGEASAMEFDEFAGMAHNFESNLETIKNIRDITGAAFLPLTVKLEGLISYIETMEKISSHFVTNNDVVIPLPALNPGRGISDLTRDWEHLPKLVNKIASELNKKVKFVMCGLVEVNLNNNYRNFINNAGLQLIRNSLIHGVELPEKRVSKNKPESGRIDLRVSKLDGGFIEIIIRDDGVGFSMEKIAQRLVDQGLASDEEINSWSVSKIVSMAFKPGVSTADETTINAGRGVGLNVVLDDIKALNGKLKVSQIPDKFCQFEITLPPVADSTTTSNSRRDLEV